MKNFIIVLVLSILTIGVAKADYTTPVPTNPTLKGNTVNGSNSNELTGVSESNNAGNSQNINFAGSAPQKQMGNVGANFIATSNDTCMGSVSGGVTIIGLGASAGSTYVSAGCHLRAMAITSHALGDTDQAIQILCADPTTYQVRLAMGKPCYVKPDITLAGTPGGQLLSLAQPSGYRPTYKAPVANKVVETDKYVTRAEYNQKLNNLHTKSMSK
jgi:hypothetical protein